MALHLSTEHHDCSLRETSWCKSDEGVPGMVPSIANSKAQDPFQQEVRNRLLMIETKLDHVAQQFMGHACIPMPTTRSDHVSLTKQAQTATESPTMAVQQATLACTTLKVTRPCSVLDETEAGEAEVLADALNATTSKDNPCSRKNSTVSSSSSSSSSNSHSKRVKLQTPQVPLDRGATWLRTTSHKASRKGTLQHIRHSIGLHATMNLIAQLHGRPSQDAVDKMKTQPLWSFVHSNGFRAVARSMVILNVVFVGFLTEEELRNSMENRQKSSLWAIGNVFFCVYFLVEIALRFMAERTMFFNGPHFRWNFFDSLTLTMSVLDTILDISSGTSATQNVTIARVLRFSRLMRIISIARLMRACQSLRLVVLMIFESMSSLAVCFLVLGFFIFIFAIFVVQGVTAHLRWQGTVANGGVQEIELRKALLEFFGGVPASAICLFMMVSGGIDWRDAMLPMKQVHDFYEYFFTFYVFFMVVGVLNVVIGAFVAATGEIVTRDRDLIIKSEMANLNTYLEKVSTFFSEADVDGSGKLSLEEFKAHLDDKHVCAYFHALGIDVSQAELVFHLLDKDSSQTLALSEFLSGCMRLRGPAKSLDVNVLLHETRHLSKRLMDLKDSIEAQQRDALSDASLSDV